jgi:hypothetical protein
MTELVDEVDRKLYVTVSDELYREIWAKKASTDKNKR